MSTRHLVDPELLPLLDLWPAVTMSAEVLEQARSWPAPPQAADDDGVVMERISVPGPAGAPDLGLVIFRPAEPVPNAGGICHMHGGGFVLGAPEGSAARLRPMVAALGCVIVSVDYRLAPETPFPGPIEDCYAGLAWTFANAARLRIDPARIGVMGESAGGGLAAALALLARDRCDYRLAFQHLLYPMIDDRTGVIEGDPLTGEFIWSRESNRFGWQAMLGQAPGGEGVSPYAAAARAEDLTGLPPTYIATGSLDLFRDENIAYAQRLLAAGVPTEFHIWPGAIHGFDGAPDAAITREANQSRIAALRRVLKR
ncbi:alpha/beta hydrolase [Sphingomonas sp. Ag1]|jgi:triacylglycerol lipase|uniref:alpha/beta hydrolase n=1 Tax=Sphingomonas sp. Ag1 TaxID=1642949 RepID=UPI0006217110|nr:alpha/beta hydrolase [Sphingomonas sp. Ag1]KKI20839.1 arylesterase [Sphingomonas sp. Ag1]